MVVLANLAQIAGIYFWALIDGIVRSSEDALLADNVPLVTATGVVFIAAMTWVSWRGVEIGERIQNVLLGIQYLALAIFVVAALWHFFAGTAPDPTPFDWSWFNPFAFTDWSGFVEAILLALFIYWGWDTCLALNEETKDPKRIPGPRGAADHRHPARHLRRRDGRGDDVRGPRRDGDGPRQRGERRRLLPRDQGRAARSGRLGARGRRDDLGDLVDADDDPADRARNARDGGLQGAARAVRDRAPRYKTPSFSTLVMGIVAIVYYVGMTLISDNILQDSILSLGLAIAFYYAITGYACVWYFRGELFTSARNFFYKFLFPLLGALMLTYAFVQSAIDMYDVDYGYTVAARHRRHVRARHRRARVRRAADVPLVRLPALEAVLPRREPQPRDAGARPRRPRGLHPLGRRRPRLRVGRVILSTFIS